VPYEEAVALVGEAALFSHKPSRGRKSNWRSRGVPWEIVGPLLVERYVKRSGEPAPVAPEGIEDIQRRTAEHLRRQSEYLAMIPRLMHEVAELRARLESAQAMPSVEERAGLPPELFARLPEPVRRAVQERARRPAKQRRAQ